MSTNNTWFDRRFSLLEISQILLYSFALFFPSDKAYNILNAFMVVVTLSSYLFLLFGDLISFPRKNSCFSVHNMLLMLSTLCMSLHAKEIPFEASTERDEKMRRLGTLSLRGEYLDRLHFKRFVIEIV